MDVSLRLSLVLLGGLCVICLVGYTDGLRARLRERESRLRDEGRVRMSARKMQHRRQKRSEKPNIVLVITDDQDSELGSMNFMPKTLRLMQDEGATFSNAFVTTPMCCPSRSSMLTGMYVHNHNVYTNNDNCSSVQWQRTHETRNFGTYLSNAGYRTGYFGKYLNEYTGTYVPPGWSEWVGLIRNTRFYNYTLNFNGKKIKHADNYYRDYLTDLIANDSVTFLKQSKQYFPNRPVAMVLSMPAPHGPEDSAPQYQHLFENITTHRTPSWNYAPNPDKQWILQYTGKMEPIHIAFTDLLQRKRLQTLQSVDDAVEKVITELKQLGELDNTYVIYTSDHGYHLGHYGLLKGKAMPYDFDVRVPFYARGPKIPKGVRVPNIVLNLDLAPTMLDIAGIPVPDHMDGRSMMKLFEGLDPNSIVGGQMKRKKAWRDTFMVERGKITHKKLIHRERMEARKNNLVLTKEQRLAGECGKAEYQPPCKGEQQWECREDSSGKLRMYKCRHNKQSDAPARRCVCPESHVGVDGREKRRQRQFLKDHVNQPEMLKPRFIRSRRQLVADDGTSDPSSKENLDGDRAGSAGRHIGPFNMQAPQRYRGTPRAKLDLVDVDISATTESGPRWRNRRRRQAAKEQAVSTAEMPVSCRVLPNNTVVCNENVYDDFGSWRKQKEKLDRMIQEFRDRLERLKDVRKHLRLKKPEPTTQLQETLSKTTRDSTTLTPLPYSEDVAMALYGEDDVINGQHEPESCDCSQVATADSGGDFHKEENSHLAPKANKKNRLDRRQKRKNRKKGMKSEKRRKMDVTKDCNSKMMKCFTHDNTHWKTAPLWNSTTLTPRPLRKVRGKVGSRNDPACHIEGLECSRMDDQHWKVEPRWKMGPFCFCPNSNNNTYWCIRTINDTHNFLYCEFITGFMSFYDMTTDPYQLRNAVHDLSFAILHELHDTLEKLKSCRGVRECTVRYRPPEDGSDPALTAEGSGEVMGSGEVAEKVKVASMYETLSGSGDGEDIIDPAKEDFLWLSTQYRLDNPWMSGRRGDHKHRRHHHGNATTGPAHRGRHRHRNHHGHVGPP